MSFGGIGRYLVNKFIKQTKIHSWLAHESSFDQVLLIEAKSDKGASCTRILGKANSAVRQEQPGLDPSHRVID